MGEERKALGLKAYMMRENGELKMGGREKILLCLQLRIKPP